MHTRPRSRIRSRLFFFFALQTIAVVLTISLCLYSVMAPSLKSTASDMLLESARVHMQNIDQTIRAMNGVSVNIVHSAIVRAAMEDIAGSGKLSYDRQRELAEHLMTINGPMLPVAQIRLYSTNGHVLATGMYSGQYTYDPDEMPWTQAVWQADGGKVLGAPVLDAQVSSRHLNTLYIPLRRVIKSGYRQSLGIVEVITNASHIFSSLSGEITVQPYIINSLGEMIYPAGSDRVPAAQEALSIGQDEGVLEGTDAFVAWRASSESDWLLVVTQSRGTVLGPLRHMVRITLASAAGLLFLALAMAYLFSGQFTKPIAQLAGRMRRFQVDSPGAAPRESSGIDELATLNDAFDQLTCAVSQAVETRLLLEQQALQARMLALQSQMNPHFLHNALSNVEALSEAGDGERTVSMIQSMSRMLRYIASDAQTVVTLEDELRHVGDYVACMRIRYGDNLRFSQANEGLPAATRIPKLIIQPLVENAVKFGCTGAPPWHIGLTLSAQEGGWRIAVRDSGPGFDAATLDTLRRQLKAIRAHGVLPRMEIDGMGLLNIAMRLHLYMPGRATFDVDNMPDGGGRVAIGWQRAEEED